MNSYFLFISFQSCDYLRKKVSVCCQYVVFRCLFLAVPVPPTPFYLKINLIEVNLQKTNCTNINCEFDDCVYTHNHQHSQGRCPSCPLPPGLVNPSLCIWPWETTDLFLSLQIRLHFLEFKIIRGIIQDLCVSCLAPFTLCNIVEIHQQYCVYRQFILIAEQPSFVWIYQKFVDLFTYQQVFGFFLVFYFSYDKVSLNICKQALWGHMFLFLLGK